MSVALYRKYRPKNFSEVTNQNHIKVTLQNEIESGKLGHAYLFCGPRGTGKTTLARLLSKAVNCTNIQPNAEPCNECASCQDIMNGRAMDVIEIDAASNTGVENVRENIIGNARFTPTGNKYKVFIIDEVHMLSTSAFNALLKTLEEPPKHAIFVLATTETHKVPATIISRCQRFDFKKIMIGELTERLKWITRQEGVEVEDEVLRAVARQAGGCVRDAESLLEQVLSLGEKKITMEKASLVLPRSDSGLLAQLFDLVLNKNTNEAISFVNNLIGDGLDLGQFTDNFVDFARQVLLYKITGNVEELSREVEESVVRGIVEKSANISELYLKKIIEETLKARELYKKNHLTQLPLEMAILELTLLVAPVTYAAPRVEPVVSARVPIAQAEPARSVEPAKNIPFNAAVEPIQPVEPVTSTPVIAAALRSPLSDLSPAPAPEPVSMPSISSGQIDWNTVLSSWPRVMDKLSEKHAALSMALCVAKPVQLKGDVLILGFLFDLQRQRVENMSNKRIISEALSAELGVNLAIETRLESALRVDDVPVPPPQDNFAPQPPVSAPVSTEPRTAVDDLASEFGGVVVEGI